MKAQRCVDCGGLVDIFDNACVECGTEHCSYCGEPLAEEGYCPSCEEEKDLAWKEWQETYRSVGAGGRI